MRRCVAPECWRPPSPVVPAHVQVLRYTVPFLFISAVFWFLHTWILDPMPNKFRRQVRRVGDVVWCSAVPDKPCGPHA
jgi:hypothetical protein